MNISLSAIRFARGVAVYEAFVIRKRTYIWLIISDFGSEFGVDLPARLTHRVSLESEENGTGPSLLSSEVSPTNQHLVNC